jgi:protease IV
MRDSIFYSAFRAFLVTFLAVIGFCLALLIIALGLSALSSSTSTEPTTVFTPEIMADADGKRKSLSSEPVILRININGIIGLDGLEQENIRQMLVESREGVLKDNLVKGILLYMQTPGGTVTDADGIYRAILEYKKRYKVPVYAYVDGLCASGGMYISAAADKVLASDSSIVGSIGVIAPSALNFSQLLEKVGVQSLTLFAGKGKDDLNPLRPWKQGEDANYKSLIDYFYEDFVNIMTSSRSQLDKTKLVKEYGAKVFPAPEGKENGYIDESGVSLDDAIRQLVKQMNVEDYRVVQLSKQTWISELLKSHLSLQGTVKHQLYISPEYDPQLMGQFQYMYRPW